MPNHWKQKKLGTATRRAAQLRRHPATATRGQVIWCCWRTFDIWKDTDSTDKVFAVLKKQPPPTPSVWMSECPQNPFGILCCEGSMLLVGLWPAQSLLCWNNAAVVLPNLITPSRGRKATAPNPIVRSSDLGSAVRKGLIHFPSRLPLHSHKQFLFFTMPWFSLTDANYVLIYTDMCPVINVVASMGILLPLWLLWCTEHMFEGFTLAVNRLTCNYNP